MNSIERKVWIFNTEETPPSREDSFEGHVIALHRDGYWIAAYHSVVAADPDRYIKWMQYPDLAQHRKEFPNETD